MTSHERVPLSEIRELLFADLDVAGVRRAFRPSPASEGPDIGSALLALAATAEAGDAESAGTQLRLLLGSGPETRVRLQAWALARRAGVPPAGDARRIRGVIVDMGLEAGVDTVAAYEDGSARYLAQAGGGIFWEVGQADGGDVRSAIAHLLEAGQRVVDATGPLEEQRPDAPSNGIAQIWLLTDGGIHLGMGPADLIGRDALGGPVLAAALGLMTTLIEKVRAGR
jgi:hypothetical protein